MGCKRKNFPCQAEDKLEVHQFQYEVGYQSGDI